MSRNAINLRNVTALTNALGGEGIEIYFAVDFGGGSESHTAPSIPAWRLEQLAQAFGGQVEVVRPSGKASFTGGDMKGGYGGVPGVHTTVPGVVRCRSEESAAAFAEVMAGQAGKGYGFNGVVYDLQAG